MDSPKQRHFQSRELEEKVRDYYDDNTKLFLNLGADARTQSIHQPLYLQPGDTLARAMHSQHGLILPFIPSGVPTHVLDLGCGVGSSILYLAGQTDQACRFTGITLSTAQAKSASEAIRIAGLTDRAQVVLGSYLEIPPTVSTADCAYAIESLVHATDAARFFTQIAQRLNSQGVLIVFDDVLVPQTTTPTNRRILREFRHGWQGYGLRSVGAYARMARCAGLTLTESRDLTDALRLYRLRDRVVSLITPIARAFTRRSSYCTFLVGGNARQQAYRRGLLTYRMLVFHKKQA